MRRLSGVALMPADTPVRTARVMLVELRDETVVDQPAPLLASARQDAVECRPGGRVPFALAAPEAPGSNRLGLRVHLDMAGTGAVRSGDLLSTIAVPVPPAGDVDLIVPLTLVGSAP